MCIKLLCALVGFYNALSNIYKYYLTIYKEIKAKNIKVICLSCTVQKMFLDLGGTSFFHLIENAFGEYLAPLLKKKKKW